MFTRFKSEVQSEPPGRHTAAHTLSVVNSRCVKKQKPWYVPRAVKVKKC